MKIGLASDHRGYLRKEELKLLLDDFSVVDFGTFSEEIVDYPIYSLKLSEAVVSKEVDLGIILCGTGIGVSIACNKVNGSRCAKIDNINEAKSAKEHNNANILAFSSSHTKEEIISMIREFLNAKFNEDPRYIRRIKMVERYEETYEY